MRDIIKSSDARVFVKNYTKLLTIEDEKALFQKWWQSNPEGYADFMDPESATKKFTGGEDNIYLSRIIMNFSPIIRWAIREVASYKADEDELLSEGLIALSEAARRYAPSDHDNARFSGYAKICVKGLLQGYIMRNFFPVQFCTNHGKKKLFFALRKKMATELKKTGHFSMTQDLAVELSEEHNVEVRDVFQMHNLFRKPSISTDTEVASSQDPWSSGQAPLLLMDTLVDTTNAADPVFLEDEISFHKSLVKQAMSILTEREKTIFTAQILSEKEDQRTLEDLGGQFGVSKERIRQIRIEAMRKVDLELHRMLPDPNMSDIF